MAWHPRLDDIERETEPYSSARNRDNRIPETRGFTAMGQYQFCWCGLERPHDWEGKADGMPHPRGPDDD